MNNQANSQVNISLLQADSFLVDSKYKKYVKKNLKDKYFILFIVAALLALSAMFIIQNYFTPTEIPPIKIEIPWYKYKQIIMETGTSRVLQPLFYSGYDDRTSQDYKSVTQRQIKWTVEPEGIVTIDLYGRMNAIKQGTCKITLTALANTNAKDQRNVLVVAKRLDNDIVPKRVINFAGVPAQVVINLQKIVQRFSKQQIIDSTQQIPQTVRYAVQHLNQKYPALVSDGDINWQIVNFADGSNRRYVKRQNVTMESKNRDKYQYFMGDRYIPDQGVKPIMIQTDKKFGIWIVAETGSTNHIKMIQMTHSQKAEMMVQQTEKYVMRYGLAAAADWNGSKWIPQITDNDGLWTALYASGQLMKYAVLKQRSAEQSQITKARQRAIKSLKSVLMIANIPGRQGKVNAKIRYLNNTLIGEGAFFSKQYLKQGKQNCRETYSGRPSDGVGFFGLDAGKNIKGNQIAGNFKYSMLPLRPDDWNTSGSAAFTQRNLGGFISRTFLIPGVDQTYNGGLLFRRHENGTQTVINGANTLYDYKSTDHPNLQLGNKPLPKVLQSCLFVNGIQYNTSDVVYKGDTSTDSVIAHWFIYKIAYDILDESDQQQKQLKELIRQTMRNFCQHLINNGYTMVDATGQATKWIKLNKQFFLTDYTIQDAPLKAIELVLSFKLAYYVTGQKKFKQQYDLLTKDQKFRYIDLIGLLWERWVWAFTKNDDIPSGHHKLDPKLNPSQVQTERHTLYQIHFSDEQEAFLAYYVAFQLEEDPQMRSKYKKGIDSYWHSISRSQNPLWYYIYQLSYPQEPVKDAFKNDLREVAAWQLSRHMIDSTKYQAFIKGARNDVIFEGSITVDPLNIVGTRTSKYDEQYVSDPLNSIIFAQFNASKIYEIKVVAGDQRSIKKYSGASFNKIDQDHNANSMQACTMFTLPYWFGVYHHMIKFD